MRKVLFVFSILSDEDVDWMTSNGHRQKLAVAEALVQEGRTPDSLYIVLDGAFALTMASRGGAVVARSGTGEVIGEVSFVDSRPPIGSVIAQTPATVLCLPRTLVAERLRKDEAFGVRFYRAIALTLAYRLRKTMIMTGNPGASESHGADELDDTVLDNVHLAGARFERMLKRVLVA